MNSINALESHIQLLEGKVAIQETVNNLLEQKIDDLEAYSRRPCTILSGIQKPKEETQENMKTSVLENLQKTGLQKEEIERNIDKLHQVGKSDHRTQTQLIIVKLRPIVSKTKSTTSKKSLQKELKSPHR